ncbi:hypothetical protein OsJ_33998 [Oryza sativa Japonica Group]|uniref:Uncharacterized protein n=1 Tax=Oryza sativa subsp. japonica TaxID=39947 RepID=B9GAU9_ORYSJ|nr:hypothetical protein OsJ_33998 [Oryza sativa Japonica Group]
MDRPLPSLSATDPPPPSLVSAVIAIDVSAIVLVEVGVATLHRCLPIQPPEAQQQQAWSAAVGSSR